MEDSQKQNYAVEEWKLCQSVISQLENGFYRRQGWFIALITALIIAVCKEKPFLTKEQFWNLSIVITISFFAIELFHRVPHHRAIQHSKKIEAHLRGEDEYKGPRLSDALGQGCDCHDIGRFWYKPRVWFPYAAALLIVWIVSGQFS